ncbi:MAG: hypothetical protein ACLFQ8_02245 [Candidatus Aenigmatarchaeota archaeon]
MDYENSEELRDFVDERVLEGLVNKYISRDEDDLIVEACVPIPEKDEGLIIVKDGYRWLLEDRHYTHKNRTSENSFVEGKVYEIEIDNVHRIEINEDVDDEKYAERFHSEHLTDDKELKASVSEKGNENVVGSSYRDLGKLTQDLHAYIKENPEPVEEFSRFLDESFMRD